MARLLAAADRRRGDHPRLMPEGARAERAEAAARTALGDRWRAEYASGAALADDALLDDLGEALRAHPAATGDRPTSR